MLPGESGYLNNITDFTSKIYGLKKFLATIASALVKVIGENKVNLVIRGSIQYICTYLGELVLQCAVIEERM